MTVILSHFKTFPDFSKIRDKYVQFQVLLGEQKMATLDFPEVRVNDGEWHHLLVELRSSKDGKDTKYMANVYLDYDMFMVSSVVLTKQNKKN